MAGVSAGAPAGGTAVRAPHLVRRFAGSLSGRPPSEGDTAWAHAQLTAAERALWDRMAVQDRRHSVQVARRFVAMAPAAEREAVAGALLHDVGKQVSGLGTFARVVATVVGAHGRRFREYHEHESLGVAMLRDAGSSTLTVDTASGRGPYAATLRAADDV